MSAPRKPSEVVPDPGPCFITRSTWYCPRTPLRLLGVDDQEAAELSALATRVVGSTLGLRPGWWQVTS